MRLRNADLRLILLGVALLLSGGRATASVALDCPCSVVSTSQAAVEITTGLRSTSWSEVATGLELRLVAAEEDLELSRRTIASAPLESIAAGGTRDAATVVAALERPEGPDQLLRLELVSDRGLLDSARLEDPVTFTGEGGAAARTSSPFYTSDPVLTGGDGFLQAAFAELRGGTSRSHADIELQLWATETADLFGGSFFRLDSAPLVADLPAGASVENLSARLEPGFDAPESHSVHHLVLVEAANENSVLAWYTPDQDAATIQRIALDQQNIDFVSDTDGDGATDFSEMLVGTDPGDPAKAPRASVVRLLFLYSDAVAGLYGEDLSTRVAHLVAYGNVVLEESGTRMRLRRAGLERVGADFARANDELLDDATTRTGSFTGLDALRSEARADLVVVLDVHDAGDSCGVAWLNGEALRGDLTSPSERDTHAVTVVDADCDDATLVHEVGHLLGLGHSRRQGSRGTFPWSVGHGIEDAFATVMAYTTSFGSSRTIDIFSSPRLTCDEATNTPCGVARTDGTAGADAAASLDVVRVQAARFVTSAAPTITLVGDATVEAASLSAFDDPGARAGDDVDGDLTAAIERTRESLGGGVHRFRYSVEDSDGNRVSVIREVTVGTDTDEDGILDSQDADDDGDGVPDTEDAFPKDARYVADQDEDGIADAIDDDRDGDGFNNAEEAELGLDPDRANSCPTPVCSNVIDLIRILEGKP